MKKFAWVAALVLLGGVPAAPWFIGGTLESRLNQTVDSLVSQVPFVVVSERRFRRGWFASEHYLTLRLAPGFGAGAAAHEVPKRAEVRELKLKNIVRHGPLPGFTGVGLARIDTEFVTDAKTDADLRKVFGASDPLDIRTTLGFTGSGRTRVRSPAVSEVQFDGGTFSFGGLDLALGFDRRADNLGVKGEMPRLAFAADDGSALALDGVTVAGELKRARGPIYAGTVSMRVQSMLNDSKVTGDARARAVEQVRVDDILSEVRTTSAGDYLAIAARFGAAKFAASGWKGGPLHYDLTFNRLHTATLDRLTTAMRETMHPNDSDADGAPDAAIGQLGTGLLQLLEHDPELLIDRISFALAEGEFKIQGVVGVKGLKREDIVLGARGLLPKIDTAIDIAVDEGLIERLGRQPGDAASIARVQDPIDAIVKKGFAKRAGRRISSRITFKLGQFRVNDRELGAGPPLPMPGQISPETAAAAGERSAGVQ